LNCHLKDKPAIGHQRTESCAWQTTSRLWPVAPYGSWRPVCLKRLSKNSQRAWHDLQYEPQGQLLRQCLGGKFLCPPQERVGKPPTVLELERSNPKPVFITLKSSITEKDVTPLSIMQPRKNMRLYLVRLNRVSTFSGEDHVASFLKMKSNPFFTLSQHRCI
jgi:hypothetical protein